MSEIPPRDIRIGDTERTKALQVLGEHMSAGRIDIDEYGDRSARITTAKTRGDLLAIFKDLPDPRPQFGVPAPMFPEAPSPAPRWTGAVVPAVGLAVVALVFITKLWILLLIIPAAAILLGKMQGGRR